MKDKSLGKTRAWGITITLTLESKMTEPSHRGELAGMGRSMLRHCKGKLRDGTMYRAPTDPAARGWYGGRGASLPYQ